MCKLIIFLEKYPVIIVFLLSLLPLYPLLHQGMFTGHDSESHIARLVAFYQSLSEGNLVPRWAGGLNMGFGHPVLMFLYPMSNYLGSLVHFFGFGFSDSVKIVFAMSYILSGVFMYAFVNEVWGRKAGLISAVIYLFSPYRFVDMYVRAALGEHIAFMFMPLVLFSFYKLTKYVNTLSSWSPAKPDDRISTVKNKILSPLAGSGFQNDIKKVASGFQNDCNSSSWSPAKQDDRISLFRFYHFAKSDLASFQNDKGVWLIISSLSLAGLILSHNAISLMFLPFLLLFITVLILFSKNKLFVTSYSLLVIILGFSLSAFFWAPALWEGKYTLRDVLTVSVYSGNFPTFLSLFYSPWSFGGSQALSKQIGIINWAAVVFGIVYLFKSKKQDLGKAIIAITAGYFLIIVLLLNKFSEPIWQLITIIQKFQFPWRLLTITVLTTAISGVAFLLVTAEKKRKAVTFVIVLFTIILSIPNWRVQGYLAREDTYYIYDYSGTTDTGESSPMWSTRGVEEKAKKKIELIGGIGTFTEVYRNSTIHIYKITADNELQFLDNTVYFPGWKAYADKVEVPVEYQDLNHRGLITFRVPKGTKNVEVRFEDTKLRRISNIISLTSLFALFGILVISRHCHSGAKPSLTW